MRDVTSTSKTGFFDLFEKIQLHSDENLYQINSWAETYIFLALSTGATEVESFVAQVKNMYHQEY